MNTPIHTPEGMRDLLFSECRTRRQMRETLSALFRRRGYLEIMTPELEFYDLFLATGNPIAQERMVKIIDRSGKILVLRPDCTTPIARVAATKLKNLPMPQRFYYDQTVFRSDDAHQGTQGDIMQCGVEFIGAQGMKSHFEIIALAIDALKCCRVPMFYIELGHVNFCRDLLAQLPLDGDETEQALELIEKKDFAALEHLLMPYGDATSCQVLRMLPYLFGGEEALCEAEQLAPDNEALAYLRELYEGLCKAGYSEYIRFDLGLVHKMDYYTGLIFRGYAAKAGAAVLSGGRYDKLAESLGRPAEAIGFAVDVDRLSDAVDSAEMPNLETVIHFEIEGFGSALAALEAAAEGTAELSPCRNFESSKQLARDKGAKTVLICDSSGERMVQV